MRRKGLQKMTLTELDAISPLVLPVRELADHLRMGSGFSDDLANDPILETYLRAAIAAVEARSSKVLIRRRFSAVFYRWSCSEGQVLPIAPVTSIESVTLKPATGTPVLVDPTEYLLETDTHCPLLRPTGTALPSIAAGGSAHVTFFAGYSPDWNAVPPALAQAVMMTAANFFEHRTGVGETAAMPFGVEVLIAPFQFVGIGKGAV